MSSTARRLRLFAFLIVPADLWIRFVARLCGIHYEPFLCELDDD